MIKLLISSLYRLICRSKIQRVATLITVKNKINFPIIETFFAIFGSYGWSL